VDISLFSASGDRKGQVDLKEYFGDEDVQARTLHEVVTTYQRNARRGTSMTKTRGLVRGGGRKPWKQKGTGNARSGSIRSPLWRKGGIIFGPVPRCFHVDLPEVKRRDALKSAVWLKAKAGALVVLEQLDAKLDKTQKAHQFMSKVSTAKKALLLSDTISAEHRRAFSNLKNVCLDSIMNLNALDVMKADAIVVTLPALKLLSSRLAGASHA